MPSTICVFRQPDTLWERRSDATNGAVGYDHRNAAADETGCKRRQPIILIFRPAVFNRNILALDIAAFLEALEERNGEELGVISGLFAEEPDHRHRQLLRRHRRPHRRAPQPRDELPPSHPVMLPRWIKAALPRPRMHGNGLRHWWRWFA